MVEHVSVGWGFSSLGRVNIFSLLPRPNCQINEQMSSVVHNLQKAIIEGKQSLTQLLRQTKLIAAKLNLTDMEAWVTMELNGYIGAKHIPEYREVTTDKLMMHSPFRGWEYVGDVKSSFRTHESIAEVERLARGEEVSFPPPKNFGVTDGLGRSSASHWPQRVTVDSGQYKNILDAVKNELLNWSIELEKRGIKGEDMDFDEKEKQAAANQVFNIGTVHGTVGNLTNSQVTVCDYSSVNQLLIDHKVPKQDRRELEDIMDELKDAPPEKKASLLKRGEDWIVKHKELLGASAEAVGRAIGAAIGKTH